MIYCDQCPKPFGRQSSLIRHKKHAHLQSSSRYVCEQCSQTFTRLENLARHQSLHRGTGLEPCYFCLRQFRPDYLRSHLTSCHKRQEKHSSLKSTRNNTTPRESSEAKATTFSQLQWQSPEGLSNPANDGVSVSKSASKRCDTKQPARFVFTPTTRPVLELRERILEAISYSNSDFPSFLEHLISWKNLGLGVDDLDLALTTRRRFEGPHTILAYACVWGEPDMVTCLIKEGSWVDARGANGWTALHFACHYGHLPNVVRLLKLGASPSGGTKETPLSISTPISLAASRSFEDIVLALTEAGASVQERTLALACQNDHIQVVKVLLNAGADVDCGKGYALQHAILKRDLGMIEVLAEYGPRTQWLSSREENDLDDLLRVMSANVTNPSSSSGTTSVKIADNNSDTPDSIFQRMPYADPLAGGVIEDMFRSTMRSSLHEDQHNQ